MMLRGGYHDGRKRQGKTTGFVDEDQGEDDEESVSRLIAVSGPSIAKAQSQKVAVAQPRESIASMVLHGRTRRMLGSTTASDPEPSLRESLVPVHAPGALAASAQSEPTPAVFGSFVLPRAELLEVALEGGSAALQQARSGLSEQVRSAVHEGLESVQQQVRAAHGAAMQHLARYSDRSVALLEDAAQLRQDLLARADMGVQTEYNEAEEETEEEHAMTEEYNELAVPMQDEDKGDACLAK